MLYTIDFCDQTLWDVECLGKYHFLPLGGSWNFGGTHEFWKSKGANRRIFGTIRELKNFIDPIGKKSKY